MLSLGLSVAFRDGPEHLIKINHFWKINNCYFSDTGMAIDKNGLIYFVDGTMIRRVDQNGIISTVLGSNDLTSARPLTCDTSMHISQVAKTLHPMVGLSSKWLDLLCQYTKMTPCSTARGMGVSRCGKAVPLKCVSGANKKLSSSPALHLKNSVRYRTVTTKKC